MSDRAIIFLCWLGQLGPLYQSGPLAIRIGQT